MQHRMINIKTLSSTLVDHRNNKHMCWYSSVRSHMTVCVCVCVCVRCGACPPRASCTPSVTNTLASRSSVTWAQVSCRSRPARPITSSPAARTAPWSCACSPTLWASTAAQPRATSGSSCSTRMTLCTRYDKQYETHNPNTGILGRKHTVRFLQHTNLTYLYISKALTSQTVAQRCCDRALDSI